MNSKTRNWLLVAVGVTAAAMLCVCSNPGEPETLKTENNAPNGTAWVKMCAASGSSFSTIADSAVAVVSAPDMHTITGALTITDSTVEGIITGIPVGKNRSIEVFVYDSTNALRYRGTGKADVFAEYTTAATISIRRVSGNVLVNGTISDSADTQTTVSHNYALHFDGNDDFALSKENIAITGAAPRTIEAWIMMGSSRNMPVFYWGTGTLNEGSMIGITEDNGPRFGYWSVWNDVLGTTKLKANTWYHVAVVYDNNGSERSIYLNGVKEVTQKYQGSDSISKIDILSTVATQLNVGQYHLTSGWGSGFFEGAIDEIRIWNIARSGEQIKADLNRPLEGNEAGLKYYYPFNEGSGRTAADIAGGNSLKLGKTESGTDAPQWIKRE